MLNKYLQNNYKFGGYEVAAVVLVEGAGLKPD